MLLLTSSTTVFLRTSFLPSSFLLIDEEGGKNKGGSFPPPRKPDLVIQFLRSGREEGKKPFFEGKVLFFLPSLEVEREKFFFFFSPLLNC